MTSFGVENVLERIRATTQNIAQVYISTDDKHHAIEICQENLRNLDRVSNSLSFSSYSDVRRSIEALLDTLVDNEATPRNQRFVAYSIRSGVRGRPKIDLHIEELKQLVKDGYSAKRIAHMKGCSTSLVYNTMYSNGIKMKDRYTDISDDTLKEKISSINTKHPNAGYVMMDGHLRSTGTYVKRQRVRSTLAEVDPVGTASRWGKTCHRRAYSVPCPNSLWHIDAHMKLIRWGIVTHGCVDGFSRLIPYIACEISATAEIVVYHFIQAATKYGLPSRVRSDHGGENVSVALLMNIIRGENRARHITGLSVHNQRIERLWRDVHLGVTHKFYNIFYEMENDGILSPDNQLHRSLLQFIFIPLIQKRLDEFKRGYNEHRIRSERNRTPLQIWQEGMAEHRNSNHTAVNEILQETKSLHERLIEKAQELLGQDFQPRERENRTRELFGLSTEQHDVVKDVQTNNPEKCGKDIFVLSLAALST